MSTGTVERDRSGGSAMAVAVVAAAAAFALLYRDVVWRLVAAWDRDPNYSHGFVIVPTAAYIAWHHRDRLRHDSGRWVGLAGMAGAFVLLVAGELGAELFLTRVSLVVMLASLVVLLWGWRGLRHLGLSLVLVLLTLPLPSIVLNQVTFPLQLLASQAGESVLQVLQIPVLREGNIIVLPHMTLEVAEACSGIRSLTSLLSLAVVYGYFTHTSLTARAALAGASVPIAIMANAARVAGTGIAAHYYGPGIAESFLHTFSGWLVFVVALALLLAFDSLVMRRIARRPQTVRAAEVTL